MAANNLPSGLNDLFLLGERLGGGLESHGPWLRLGDGADLAEALADARGLETVYAGARARKALAAQEFLAADERLTAWLAKARLVVMLALGGTWDESWVAAGFTQRRTSVPKRRGARIELGRRLVTFFTERAEFAVPFAGVTVAGASATYEEVTRAERDLRAAKVAEGRAKKRRDAAEKHLRWKMHGYIGFVGAVLGKGDARWLAFGLKIPKPGAPARVYARPGGATAEIFHLGEALPEETRAMA